MSFIHYSSISALFLLISFSGSMLSAQNRIGTGSVVQLYKQHCAVCHGVELDGGLGGSLLGKYDYAESDEDVFRWIKEGEPDLGMPPYDELLSDPEIRSLVIYLREMRQKAADRDVGRKVSDNIYEGGGYRFTLETVVEGLDIPWGMAFLPDGRWLITERPGQLRQVVDGELLRPVEGTPDIWARGQGGMMAVAVDPDYEENGWIYLGYSATGDKRGEGNTRIARGRIVDNRWIDEEVIFSVTEPWLTSSGRHFGVRIVFQDNYLFFAIGDRGDRETAQDPASPNGRVHRIFKDGGIPLDNPFLDNPDAWPSSWTLGNRNIQGMDFHPESGILWTTEHGPRGGDELNPIRKGDNYGWPFITYGMNYSGSPITDRTHAPGLEQPALEWTPSIAVCGINFYTGDGFPDWQNCLLVTGLASQELHLVTVDGRSVLRDQIILKGIGRLRTAVPGPDGAIYLVVNDPHRIVRMAPIR